MTQYCVLIVVIRNFYGDSSHEEGVPELLKLPGIL